MKAIKLTSSEQDKIRLRAKCKQLLASAEEIKISQTWIPQKPGGVILKIPQSKRLTTTTEKIILLEGSKLHGFIFPPWENDPDDTIFDDDKLFTYVLQTCCCFFLFRRLISTEMLPI